MLCNCGHEEREHWIINKKNKMCVAGYYYGANIEDRGQSMEIHEYMAPDDLDFDNNDVCTCIQFTSQESK